jgi:membrane protease YdiL (CAAX protease family)
VSWVRRCAALYPPFLMVSWIAAWTLNRWLRARYHWDAEADTIYWIAMKLLIWVLPVLVTVRLLAPSSPSSSWPSSSSSPAAFLGLRHLKRGLLWGCAAGALLIAVTFAGRTLPEGTAFRLPTLSLVLMNAVVVAPLVEEIALRGFFLECLELSGYAFWNANVWTTVLFCAMHVPGWLFAGRFPSPGGMAAALLPLAMLSLVFGWTKKRSGSLYASMIAHAINNAYHAFLA